MESSRHDGGHCRTKKRFEPVFPVATYRYQAYEETGTDLGQSLSQKKKISDTKASMSADIAKALGRISGGLYVVTAKKGSSKGAMIASWVSQVSRRGIFGTRVGVWLARIVPFRIEGLVAGRCELADRMSFGVLPCPCELT